MPLSTLLSFHPRGSDDASSSSRDCEAILSDGSEAYWEIQQAQQELAEDIEVDYITVVRESEFAVQLVDRASGKKLLRQSVLRQGQSTEAHNFYCYLHKCKKCVKASDAPGLEAVKAWAAHGHQHTTAGPRGRDAHLAEWTRMKGNNWAL